MNEQECLGFVAKELWSGVRGMALGNVGKKRIVVELAEGEEPKVSSESVSKDAIEAGETYSRGNPRVHIGEHPIPQSLNESFERLAKSINEWDKREASS